MIRLVLKARVAGVFVRARELALCVDRTDDILKLRTALANSMFCAEDEDIVSAWCAYSRVASYGDALWNPPNVFACHHLRRFLRPMQCKDIPDHPILAFLAERPGVRHNWCFDNEHDVRRSVPSNTPRKLVLGKMRQLKRRGLIDGCCCGCRGDFSINEKGLELLTAFANEPSR